jgi:hypothetical protein
VVLLFACVQFPHPSDPSSTLSLHVSSRFTESAVKETGLAGVSAVLGDYRSFDLLVLSFLFFTSALLGLVVLYGEKPLAFNRPALAGLFIAFLGVGLGLMVGTYCFYQGSNFMDYEPWVLLFKPGTSRWVGSGLLGLGMALAFLGAVLTYSYGLTPASKDPHEP